MSDDQKLRALEARFPQFEKSVLKEIYDACGGSLNQVMELLSGSAPKRKKTGLGKYQTSITSIFGGENTRKPKVPESVIVQNKAIQLYTPEDVTAHLGPYVSLYRNFLPLDLSNLILEFLMSKRDRLAPNKFFLFDSWCVANHSLGLFHDRKYKDEKYQQLIYNGKSHTKINQFDEELSRAANFVNEFINEKIIPSSSPLPFQSKEKWTCDVCVVNYYEHMSNNLDWHSDRLSHIGPHNYIASISLGATREFRVRKNYPPSQLYAIQVPHNSLVIMHPGCQEEYRHSVNALRASIQLHPISGNGRFNLTFRHYREEIIQNIPKCKCNMSMTLRRAFKTVEARGKYFWTCENKYQNKDCGTFYWANFSNLEGNLIAEGDEDVSIWYSEHDVEKVTFVKHQSSVQENLVKIAVKSENPE